MVFVALKQRVCEACKETYMPSSPRQIFCLENGCSAEAKLKRGRQWRKDNPDKVRRHSLINRTVYRVAIRKETFETYGGRCSCCGELEWLFLSIDHIGGGGAAHRKQIGGAGYSTYKWLKDHGFPKDKFRLLCANCQIGWSRGKICPYFK
jgi:hypothetical protein